MTPIVPCLWFNRNAEEAVNFYMSVFKNSKINSIAYTVDDEHLPLGHALFIEFELNGNEFQALNGGIDGDGFQYTHAISMSINCKDQKEIDYYWDKLIQGGKPEQCGWLQDKYGMYWQIAPESALKMWTDPDKTKVARMAQAMYKMVKLDIAELENAFNGKTKAA